MALERVPADIRKEGGVARMVRVQPIYFETLTELEYFLE